MLGDLNFDLRIDIRDLQILVNGLIEKVPLTLQQLAVADVNTDGAVNVSDVIAIVNIILGLWNNP